MNKYGFGERVWGEIRNMFCLCGRYNIQKGFGLRRCLKNSCKRKMKERREEGGKEGK